ncbi:tetratricopeptide repeat protein [Nonomuraea sp. NPDC000554]|uniref:tetratricopeptide repeat protein n=1 Tax=Nonomuraea sp. NPDC000554 TaxID=3154259 RepID=UPI00332A5A34
MNWRAPLNRLVEATRARPWRAAGVGTSTLFVAVVVDIIANLTGNILLNISAWLAVGVLAALLIGYLLAFGGGRPAPHPQLAPRGEMPEPNSLLGREDLLVTVVRELMEHGMITVHGPVGIGTSALAINAAWRLTAAPRYYADLRGPDPGRAEDVLSVATRVLGTLKLPSREITSAEEAFPMLDEALRGTGAVLVLDNVDNWHQVEWLARPIESAWIIVAGHLPTDHVPAIMPRVHVDWLEPDHGLRLMREVGLGPWIDAEPQQAGELAASYLRSPSVIISVADWLVRNRAVTLTALLGDLQKSTERGHGEAALGFILSRQLSGASQPARRLLAYLVGAPVAELGADAAAELTGDSRETVERHVAELTDRLLVERVGPHRYRTIDAARPAAARLKPRERHRSWSRLITFYAGQAESYAAELRSAHHHGARAWFQTEDITLLETIEAVSDQPAKPYKAVLPNLTRIADALDIWFELAQRASFRSRTADAVARLADTLDDPVLRLAAGLRRAALARAAGQFAEAGNRWNEAAARWPHRAWTPQIHTSHAIQLMVTGDDYEGVERALLDCRESLPGGDSFGRVVELVNRASLRLRHGQSVAASDRPEAAQKLYAEARDLLILALGDDVDDIGLQAHAHELLGLASWLLSQPERATKHWEEARQLYEQVHDSPGRARCQLHLGTSLMAADPEQAAELLTESLHDRHGVSVALAHLHLARLGHHVDDHVVKGLAALPTHNGHGEPTQVAEIRRRLQALRPSSTE